MKLYDYFRSSAGYRLRIALNLKKISYEREVVHLVRDGGQQFSAAYKELNPQARVPSLKLEDGTVLTQSPAILNYIEEAYPTPALLPDDPIKRAKVRAIADLINCDIHPIDNLAVLTYLRKNLGQGDDAVVAWYNHWIAEGFKAVEKLIDPAPFAFGGTPTLADISLIPQAFNAGRFGLGLDDFPKIKSVWDACNELEAFQKALPSSQSDAE